MYQATHRMLWWLSLVDGLIVVSRTLMIGKQEGRRLNGRCGDRNTIAYQAVRKPLRAVRELAGAVGHACLILGS